MNAKQENQKIFGEKLYQALRGKKLEQLTNKELGGIFDVSAVTFNRWRHGKAMPSLARIPIIAQKLEVSVEYLLDIKNTNFDKNDKSLLQKFHQLSEQEQQLLMKMIDLLLK